MLALHKCISIFIATIQIIDKYCPEYSQTSNFTPLKVNETMLTGLQAAATHLTATVDSLLHVELSMRHRCKLHSVIYRWQAGGWLSASAVLQW